MFPDNNAGPRRRQYAPAPHSVDAVILKSFGSNRLSGPSERRASRFLSRTPLRCRGRSSYDELRSDSQIWDGAISVGHSITPPDRSQSESAFISSCNACPKDSALGSLSKELVRLNSIRTVLSPYFRRTTARL